MKKKQHYWVYILQVSNNHYYTGYTNNVIRRYKEHVSGTANCRYTRAFRPVAIKQCWKILEDQGMAMKVESLIKRKSRKVKEEIIKDPGKLKSLVLKSSGLDLKIKAGDPAKVEKYQRRTN